ncbi:MAG TPA: zinc metallochaperone AztD [Microbacterium sp.]|uniref:zinc metallochaperone AztD n=1 Tax=Microbacterium sp. TaxID=51671 RepID=UPI002C591D95|nr:zinc metallochaperone AztD [Microbacterium sp.]HWI30429.1 zinc metallochaperone AztD [Microbacterium sp.]
MRTSHIRRAGMTALAIGAVATLAACSSGDDAGSAPESGSSSIPATESGARVAVAYEGGILVLDGQSLNVVADLDSEEFTRLNPAGDDRHVMVTMSEGFQVLDTAAGTPGEPALTDIIFEANAPGHVVRHGGKTILYADGTSDTTVFDTAALAASEERPEVETIEGVEAHHGVSVLLDDGTFLTTVGNAEGRSGISVHETTGALIAESDQCPGVHGEGTAENEAVVFGCENGAIVYTDGEIVKLAAPDQPYGRVGNAYVSETSPIVVGDYKNDPDAEGYLLSAVTLIDTAARTLEVVDLPEGVEYTFRDVARGPNDLAYILATDGSIHVLDPATGEIIEAFPVIEAWEGPAEWQDPHPAIVVSGDIAYVTEPAANSIHAFDLTTGEIVATSELEVTPNEIAAAAG